MKYDGNRDHNQGSGSLHYMQMLSQQKTILNIYANEPILENIAN